MAASTTDVRAWAKRRGITVGPRGKISDQLRAQYDAAAAEGTLELEPELEVITADEPAPAAEAEAAAPGSAVEARPRRPRAAAQGGRGPFAGLFNRGGPRQAKPKTAARRRAAALPRVSLAGLIEDAWSDMAWASATIPPLQRLLYAQAPMAGIGLEQALAGTFVDRALQPVARAEDKAKMVGGLLMPPAFLMLVLATAPAPYQVEIDGKIVAQVPEPSVEHKAALLGLRWSFMLMAKAGNMHLDEYKVKAEERAELGRQADAFMAYILGIPATGPEAEHDQAAAEATRAEDEAVRRAQAMFGGPEVPPG
jgi:hypothetical protein